MKKIAIFISGSGSNAENIIQYFSLKKDITVAIVLSNRADAYGLQRAKNHNVPAFVFTNKEFSETENIPELLEKHQIDFIVLAGFLCFVPESLTKKYANRMVNIHPSLLPKYGGKGMYGGKVHQAVVENKETESGITIHYINEHFDEGEIIFQAKCEVLTSDSAEDVERKVRALEIEHFPKVIESLIEKL